MAVQAKAQIEGYIGATGSGKGVSVARRLGELAPPRLLIWDPRGEYAKHAQAATLQQAVAAVAASKGQGFALRVVPGPNSDLKAMFAVLCKLAFAAGNLVFVAEELSDVTTASYAPPAWRVCLTQGRHKGLHVIGCTQRPALIDKTFLSAATVLRCFMLGYSDDCKAMGKELRVPEACIDQLVTVEEGPRTTIRYLERVRRTRELFAGQIVVQGPKYDEKRAPYSVAGQGAT